MDIKKERELEKSNFCRTLFWQEPNKNELLRKLLDKIYNLEDEIELLKNKL